jgi:hypothetical protein
MSSMVPSHTPMAFWRFMEMAPVLVAMLKSDSPTSRHIQVISSDT